jgi:hypothetical protein
MIDLIDSKFKRKVTNTKSAFETENYRLSKVGLRKFEIPTNDPNAIPVRAQLLSQAQPTEFSNKYVASNLSKICRMQLMLCPSCAMQKLELGTSEYSTRNCTKMSVKT